MKAEDVQLGQIVRLTHYPQSRYRVIRYNRGPGAPLMLAFYAPGTRLCAWVPLRTWPHLIEVVGPSDRLD